MLVRSFQPQHDITGAVATEPFVGDGRPRDVTAQLLKLAALVGVAAQARV